MSDAELDALLLDEALPPGGKGELRSEMLGVLSGIARAAKGRARSWQTAVMAASRCIEVIDKERSPEEMLKEVFGSEERLLDWMRETLPKLEARVAAKQLEVENGE